MIRALLSARYLTFSAVVILLVALGIWGRRVSYEQSINSFFAEDDPYMRVYQQAAKTFGDDNFVFVVYDDPELLTPAGLDRVAELAAAVAPQRIEGVQRVESLDAMPLSLGGRRRLARARPLAGIPAQPGLEHREKHHQEHRPEDQRHDGQRGGPGFVGESNGALGAEGSPDEASAVPRDADRLQRDDDGRGGAVEEDARAQRDRDRRRAARGGR